MTFVLVGVGTILPVQVKGNGAVSKADGNSFEVSDADEGPQATMAVTLAAIKAGVRVGPGPVATRTVRPIKAFIGKGSGLKDTITQGEV